ncbi:hypothetical protein FXV83_40785 [Bradyrhizobium hipponense]|uniref:Uncharacterized protein n=1 Tax=Bradyrhizobium hipponense TaxID=2605638 RepID=A0A5S4YAD0_9BRAD|nr:hypothetical protein FXV83_40785 [Bradyrhizobium hipponense]
MTHEVERVLADIDANHGDRCVEVLRHGVLLDLSAPCQLLALAGLEHGRTIPLADVLSRWRSQRGFCRRERSFRCAVLQSYTADMGSTCPEGTVSSGSTGSVN